MSTFQNPILPGFYPDPSICRAGDDFYLVTSSFGYFPGVPIFHSRDLMNWRQIGYVLSKDSQLPLEGAPASSGGIYAPTLRYHNGLFYLITTNVSHGGNFIVTATDPAGEWSDPIWLRAPEESGIDPSLFFDEDGSAYFNGTGDGRVQQFRIDPNTGKALESVHAVWPGTGGQYPEAPHLFRIGDVYYLTMAEGGTEYMHMQTIARSSNPYGPWEPCPHNPILTHRSRKTPFHAAGHSDFVQSPDGRWWLVFHVIRPKGYPQFHVCGRETCLAPVTWTEDGWPVVNGGELIQPEMAGTGLPAFEFPAEPARDDFDADSLGLRWNFLRNPIRKHYTLIDRPGWLGLVPSVDTLDELGQTTFVGCRQRQHVQTAEAMFDFSELAEGTEAGLTVFQTERHHYDIFARTGSDGLEVVVRRRIGDLCAEVATIVAPNNKLIFDIQATSDQYACGVRMPNGKRQELAAGEARYLGTETAGCFTGCFFGLFAQGKEKSPKPTVWVDWFSLD